MINSDRRLLKKKTAHTLIHFLFQNSSRIFNGYIILHFFHLLLSVCFGSFAFGTLPIIKS